MTAILPVVKLKLNKISTVQECDLPAGRQAQGCLMVAQNPGT